MNVFREIECSYLVSLWSWWTCWKSTWKSIITPWFVLMEVQRVLRGIVTKVQSFKAENNEKIIWIIFPKMFPPNCFWFWKLYIRKVLFSFGIINLRRCLRYVIFICLHIYLHYFLCFVKTAGSIISARFLNEKYFKTGNRIGFRVSWFKVVLKICKETRIIPEGNWFTVKCNIADLYM